MENNNDPRNNLSNLTLEEIRAIRIEEERLAKVRRRQLKASRQRPSMLRTFLWPFATTSLQNEIDIQKELIRDIRSARKRAIESLRDHGEPIDESQDLWEQLDIRTEEDLNNVLLRLYKRRNAGLLISITFFVLFVVSFFFNIHFLALIMSFVFILQGAVEYVKSQWRIDCIANDKFSPFIDYVKGILF